MTHIDLGTRFWINGEILGADQAFIPVTDRGFTLGDGLFETMLWTGREVRFFDEHMARFDNSARELGFEVPCSISDIAKGLGALGGDSFGVAAALRLTLTRGSGPRGLAIPETTTPVLIATIAPFQGQLGPVSLKTVSIPRTARAPSTQHKTLSYIDNIIALREARAHGMDDAIMLGTTGNVACASSANLVLGFGDTFLTPALDDGAFAGIVRGQLIKAGLVEEAHISPDLLLHCDSAFLTNALIGVRDVGIVNGRVLARDEMRAQKLRHALSLMAHTKGPIKALI
jgi:branched-chain amino acid aminotransferase